MTNYDSFDREDNERLKKDKRELVLQPIGGKPRSSTGLVDTSLFKGDNKLFAVKDGSLWVLRYERGVIPPALKQKFTSFRSMYDFAKSYFLKRNIEIVEVKA